MHKFSNNVNVSLVALAEIFAVVIIDEIMHTITQLMKSCTQLHYRTVQ
jgi:hypothetical protein